MRRVPIPILFTIILFSVLFVHTLAEAAGRQSASQSPLWYRGQEAPYRMIFVSGKPRPMGEELHLSVAAASDLVYAFQKIGRSFEEKRGVSIKWIFGSSGILSIQIQGGMGVDLFASASPDWVDRLLGKGLVMEKSRKIFALGQIALCTNKKSGLNLTSMEDLLKPQISRITIANPSHAPYGVAAKEALEKAGIWEKVKPKIVFAENVLQAQVYVKRGEVDVGVIALSLTNIPEIQFRPIPSNLHHPIQQIIVILSGTAKKEMAQAFIDFLTGKEGIEILRQYGFSEPGEK